MSGLLAKLRDWRKKRREAKKAARVKGPKDHPLRELIEVTATAVIMALVVRHFALEAFKIPTESMAPTLYGEVHGDGYGDQILVNKFPLYVRGPERWRITVFRFPLDVSQNYVKRIVGMPGDLFELRDGDVWVDGKIERKPAGVQESIWREVAPGEAPAIVRRDPWVESGGGSWPAFDGDRRADGREGRRRYRLRARIDDTTLVWDTEQGRPRATDLSNPVGDLRLRGELEIEAGDGRVTLRLVEHDRVYEAVLVAGGGAVVRIEGAEHAVESAEIEAGDAFEFAFVNVDDAVELHVDGDRVFRHEYETDGVPGSARVANAVEIDVEGGRARFTDLAVDRDVHYCLFPERAVTRLRIPPDRYVMLGDNSINSHDARLWKRGVFVMKDGTAHRFEIHPMAHRHPGSPRRVGSRITFVDVEGIRRDIRMSDIAEPARADGNGRVIELADGREFVALRSAIEYGPDEISFTDVEGTEHVVAEKDLAVLDWEKLDHAPFVTRKQLVGEAFFVFFPFLPQTGWRVRFLGGE